MKVTPLDEIKAWNQSVSHRRTSCNTTEMKPRKRACSPDTANGYGEDFDAFSFYLTNQSSRKTARLVPGKYLGQGYETANHNKLASRELPRDSTLK